MTEATLPERNEESVALNPRWPATPVLPGGAQIKLVFLGLMGFWYNTRGECEIGFHSTSPRHQTKIIVFEKPGCRELFSRSVSRPSPFRELVLEVFDSRGAEVTGVYFHEQVIAFTRVDTDNPKDFRWLLDMEGPDFYRGYTDKRPGVYAPRLRVRNGIFYTHQKTKSKFERTGEGPYPLGSVAMVMAANIYLDPGSQMTMTLGDEKVTLYQDVAKSYEILFTNECHDNGVPCQWDAGSANETERNDFYLNFEAFAVPSGKPRYGLKATTIVAGEGPKDFCGETVHATDDAPCMGIGYGQSSAFPS